MSENVNLNVMWRIFINFIDFSRLPFDWKTPFGYSLAWFAQAVAAHSTVLHLNLVVSFLIGSCYFVISILKDIAKDFATLNSTKTSDINHREMTGHFCNIVQFHTDARQLRK